MYTKKPIITEGHEWNVIIIYMESTGTHTLLKVILSTELGCAHKNLWKDNSYVKQQSSAFLMFTFSPLHTWSMTVWSWILSDVSQLKSQYKIIL